MSDEETEALSINREKLTVEIRNFDELIRSVDDVDERVKLLWTSIYRNAVLDRSTTETLYTRLYMLAHADDVKHITECAPLMTKYLERMHKSNEQLLQLAEQILDATTADVKDQVDDIYDQMGFNK